MITFRIEGGVKNPSVMSALEKHLFTGLGVDRANAVVRAAERNFGAIGRPSGTVDGIKGNWGREGELFFGDVPDLHLAHATGKSSSNGEL